MIQETELSNPTFIGLINNTALLLALGMVYGFFLHLRGSFRWQLASGIALGMIGVGLMMNPWQLAPGVFFDTRTILMSVGALFLGIVPMFLAMLLSSLYRIYAGGAGALTGVLWILASGCMGLLLLKIRKKPAYQFSSMEFYLFGIVVHAVMLLLLLTMPAGMGVPIIQRIALPVMLIFPLGTVLLAKLLANQELQQHHKLELDTNERKYRELVNNSQAIILRFDKQGQITFFNEFAQTFFGYAEEEIIGHNIVGTIISPDQFVSHDAKTVLATIEQNSNEQTAHENDNICIDGRRVTILWKNTPVHNDAGEITGFQSVGHDVTEQRRAEAALEAAGQQFRQLIDVSPIPLAILENNGTFTYFNRYFTDVFGYTLDDLPTIETWWQKAYPDEQYRAVIQQKWTQSSERSIDSKTAFVAQEARVTCKDGSVLDVVASLSSIGGQDIVVLTDMSRERQLDRLKSEFIATAAHELNTPLSAVMGFTELLLNSDDLERATQKEYLAIILSKTETLERIIEDLLVLSRAEGGQKIAIAREPYDLRKLIDGLLDSYRKEHRTRPFHLDWPGQESKTLSLDRIKIGQAFENLLSNAIKFSPASSPVEVRVTCTEGHVSIRVKDQGQGLSSKQVSRAFDKFYRADMSNTSIPGLGLGLSITKEIIEAHGGSIQIDSSLGDGAIVCVTLPKS